MSSNTTDQDRGPATPTSPGDATFMLPEEGLAAMRMGRAASPLFVTAATTAGAIQGVANGSIKQFKGVPYGAPTGGEGRFRAPRPAEPWVGVRECFGYGQVSPQVPMDLGFEYAMLINWDAHVGPGGMGEDCLNLNIWTPGLDAARRPVLVALHGGGWTTGSGNGPMYDGAQLALAGDAVVVTVNHRLGVLGYLGVGTVELPEAGVAGLLDLVAALEWVRDNIEAFGGDPGCVTIFGQSGGGSKVSLLMGLPAAAGLFHRAVIQSPPAFHAWTQAEGATQAAKLCEALGVPQDQPASLRELSWQALLAAQAAVGDFRPVCDGDLMAERPFAESAPEQSRSIPVMIGTTLHDRSNLFENFDVDDAGVLAIFRKTWGAKAQAIFDRNRKDAPLESAFLIQARAYTDLTRGATLLQAHWQADLQGAAVYLYEWDWISDAHDGRYGAFHAEDLDASFSLYRSPACGSGRAEGRQMVDRLVASLLAFARTGDPTNSLIPPWPRYETGRRATMVFDRRMSVMDDHRGDLVRLASPPDRAPPPRLGASA